MQRFTITVAGETSFSGLRYVKIKRSNRAAVSISWAQAIVAPKRLAAVLAEAEIPASREELAYIAAEARNITDFPPTLVLDQYGWTKDRYVKPCGRIISPRTAKAAKAMSCIKTDAGPSRGTSKTWREEVASSVVNHRLVQVLMLLPFVAPLIDVIGVHDSLAFELVGAAGTGKSIAQEIAGLMVGSVAAIPVPFAAILERPQAKLAAWSGSFLPIDDLGLGAVGVPPGKMARDIAHMLMLLGLSGRRAPVCLYTGRHPISQTPGINPEITALMADRFITLRVPITSQYGVFEAVPANMPSISAFADTLRKASRDTSGISMHCFLLKDALLPSQTCQ